MVEFKRTTTESSISMIYQSGVFKITGSLDIENPDRYLGNIIDVINSDIVADNRTDIICDISDLEYINSSALRLLQVLVLTNKSDNYKQKFKINFVTNAQHYWQTISMQVLLKLDPFNTVIDVTEYKN